MRLNRRLRRVTASLAVPVLCAAGAAYFGLFAVTGDNGLLAWVRLTHEAELREADLAAIRAEREALERRVALLDPDATDKDLLDERARSEFRLVHPNEVVIVRKPRP